MAEVVGAWSTELFSLEYKLPKREELGSGGAKQGPCVGRTIDPLAEAETQLFDFGEARASPSALIGFHLLLLSLSNPCVAPCFPNFVSNEETLVQFENPLFF